MSWQVRVIPNRYADSVRLMGVARAIRELDGVQACEAVVGTAANLEQLAALGASATATPGDIVIAVDGGGDEARQALEQAERALASAEDGAGAAPAAVRPRCLAKAAGELAAANVALISVPGEFAVLEAHRALTEGLHVFLFSDHVAVEDEVALKRRGAELGLLVMGPECGTAMLGGVGLGFANVVRPGSIGIVAAAGTGAQESACLLDAAGAGVSQIIGVGGRDLSAEVGGIMFRQAMEMLAEDEETDTLLLVSKPPAREVVETLARAAPRGMRVVASFVGWEGGDAPFEIHPTLEGGALAVAGAEVPESDGAAAARPSPGAGRSLLGLYSGGTLAHEAATIVGRDAGADILDLGDERYTQGRPHPMVDLSSRIELLDHAVRAGGVGCILMDVVLGHGAHPDPAAELAPAIERASASLPVVAHVCGTDADPQDARRQAATLSDAGALLAPSNAAAARLAAELVR